MSAQQSFRVVRDRFGWQVCFGQVVTSAFRTRRQAVYEAHRLSEALRAHGLSVEVVLEDDEAGEAVLPPQARPEARPSHW